MNKYADVWLKAKKDYFESFKVYANKCFCSAVVVDSSSIDCESTLLAFTVISRIYRNIMKVMK